MRDLVNDGNARIQRMLAELLVEAGWDEKDFLDALITDVRDNGEDAWKVPSPSPLKTHLGSLEGERRQPSRRPPAPTRSGTMPKVQLPVDHKHKKAAG